MDDVLIKFGKQVRTLRHSKKMSQEKLARLSGLHRTYVVQVEAGSRNVALKNISKIAKALGISMSELCNGI